MRRIVRLDPWSLVAPRLPTTGPLYLTAPCTFPAPWSVVEIPGGFRVEDANRAAFVIVSSRPEDIFKNPTRGGYNCILFEASETPAAWARVRHAKTQGSSRRPIRKRRSREDNEALSGATTEAASMMTVLVLVDVRPFWSAAT
jgi:hypothetical protein